MLKPLDKYYASHDEPLKSCLQFLRDHILGMDDHLTEALKYGMPFFCYNGSMCCYLWVHKKYKQPYLGVVEGAEIHHPDLLQESRARMKILLIDPEKDIDVAKIDLILKQMISLYQ